MGDFTAQVEQGSSDGEVAVTAAGELDLASAATLGARLAEVEAGGPTAILVDMTGVGFIDSTGLRVLLGAAARARDGGWRFRIAGPTDQVAKLLELTRSDAMLEIVD